MSHTGLTVTVPRGAVCGLYPHAPAGRNYFEVIDPEKVIPPASITESAHIAVYDYVGLTPGLYHCCASMEGCNAVCQMVDYQEASHLDIQLDKLVGNGYEAGYIMQYTPEFIKAQMASGKDTWGPEYAPLFQTPRFSRSGSHQQTTNEEMLSFIEKLASGNPHMHIYSLGKSPKYGYEMPLVLFTYEDVADMTLEQVARLIRSNGKPTVQYTAQCHSTEPASTEGALAMMLQLCGDYGRKMLDKLDVYIIPRINLDGAFEVCRQSPATGEDMNRDYLYMHNREIRMVVGAYNLFLPEVCIDGHEKSHDFCAAEALCTDMEVQVGAGALNHPAIMTQTAMTMALKALDKAKSLGLRSHFYAKLASAAGGSAGSSYFGTRNSLSFLVETPGQVNQGMCFMERRVMGQYVLASTVMDYTARYTDQIMEIVHGSRQKMAASGGEYDENDMIVLEHEKQETGVWATPLLHVPSGRVIEKEHVIAYSEHTGALHKRPRATAYLLPKGLPNEGEILRVTENHAIPYYKLPAGSRVNLRQYTWAGEEALLTEEKAVIFEKGAWVFPNTVPSTVLGVIMEPDFNRISGRKMTLYSMGLLEADQTGSLPIYRYCHHLVDGKVGQK